MGDASGKVIWEPVTTNLSQFFSECFVKRDKDAVGSGKNLFRARTIYSMPALFIALTIVALFGWQKNCEYFAHESRPVCFAAAKTRQNISDWRAQAVPGGTWYATDSTHWDSLMKGSVMDLGMRAYRHFSRSSPSVVGEAFWWILRHQKFHMKGVTSTGIRWSINGVQKSEAFDTCLLNSIVNIILHCYGVGLTCNIPVEVLLKSGFLLTNLGDATLFFIPPGLVFDKMLFVRTMRDWGIDLKFEDEPEKREIFLKCVPVPAATAKETDSTADCTDGPIRLPISPDSIEVDPRDGVPYSSVDAKLGVVAGSCYGKSTLVKKAKKRVEGF